MHPLAGSVQTFKNCIFKKKKEHVKFKINAVSWVHKEPGVHISCVVNFFSFFIFVPDVPFIEFYLYLQTLFFFLLVLLKLNCGGLFKNLNTEMTCRISLI